MGLFTKRATDPAELDRLRSEIATMAARLDAADAAKAQLEHRVHALGSKLDEVPPPPPPPPPPPEPVVDQADIDIIRARIQRLYDRLDEVAAAPATSAANEPIEPEVMATLEARIDRVAAELAAALDDGDPATPPTVDADEMARLVDRVDAITARLDAPTPPPAPPAPPADPSPAEHAVERHELDELHSRIEQLHERIAAVDVRITSISTELANQLSELSGDLDAIGSREADATPSREATADQHVVAEAVDELRDAQLRLANEQARYQIAFRHELAELAERLRRA